jgi:hypothetical protein
MSKSYSCSLRDGRFGTAALEGLSSTWSLGPTWRKCNWRNDHAGGDAGRRRRLTTSDTLRRVGTDGLPDEVGEPPPLIDHFPVADRRGHDRIIVIGPRDGTSYLARLFSGADLPVPPELDDWQERVDDWLDDYCAAFPEHRLLEIFLGTSVFWFDQHDTHERVVVAYGLSADPTSERDAARMRRFPDVNVGVRRAMGDEAFEADRGHFLSHAAGGPLDINLFPHRRELNRGWSEEGKIYRQMEFVAARKKGTFHFHRAMYCDDTWIPNVLEFGNLVDSASWWVEQFANR